MYWIKSCYTIQSIKDIELLQRLYNKAYGSICINAHDDTYNTNSIELVAWQYNPFKELLKIFSNKTQLKFPLKIYTRIPGPQSILGVALKINKTCKNDDPIIQKFADRIDSMVKYEINRTNDLCRKFRPLDETLNSMNQLMLAASISEYAYYVLPDELNKCIHIMNEKSVYITGIGLDGSDSGSSLMFDKDDGFVTAFSEDECKFLNDVFLIWKQNKYEGNFSDYLPDYLTESKNSESIKESLWKKITKYFWN